MVKDNSELASLDHSLRWGTKGEEGFCSSSIVWGEQ